MWIAALTCMFVGSLLAYLTMVAFTPRPRWLAKGPRLAAALVFGALIVGLPAFAAGALLRSDGRFNVVAAVCAGTTMLAYYAWGTYWIHHFTRLVRRLGDPKTRSDALLDVQAFLDKEMDGGRLSQRASRTLVYNAGILLDLGEYELLVGWLGKVDTAALIPGQPAIAAVNAALANLAIDDRVAARRALASTDETYDVQRRAFLTAADALLAALEEQYARALELAASVEDLDHPRLAALLLEARATAHAGLGETDRAEETLRTLHARCGDAALEAIVHRDSPASPLARALLASRAMN